MRSKERLVASCGRTRFQQDVFITRVPEIRLEPLQQESSLPIEVKNLFRLGDLKGIAADPIDQIIPDRHTPNLHRVGPLERQWILQAHQPAERFARLETGS